MKIHLGVIDQPYRNGASVTTADVGRFLEARYGVLGRFFELHKDQFADDLAESVAKALENIMAGAPPGIDPFASAVQDIEQQFRLFIQFEDITETRGPGKVPTQASLDRRIKFKRRRKGMTRGSVSFVETGLWSTSFKAWVSQ